LKNEIEGKKKEKKWKYKIKEGKWKKNIGWMMKLKIKKKLNIYSMLNNKIKKYIKEKKKKEINEKRVKKVAFICFLKLLFLFNQMINNLKCNRKGINKN